LCMEFKLWTAFSVSHIEIFLSFKGTKFKADQKIIGLGYL